jgi:hypothetical protein
LLSGPRPQDIVDVIRRLGGLQLDPTAAVARSEHLVLWSRIGDFDVAALDRALYRDRLLFEYGSWILPISDFDFHREAMRRYLQGSTARQRYVRGWLEANAGFRAYVLAQLRSRGPLRSRDCEDEVTVLWRTGVCNDGMSVGRLLTLCGRRETWPSSGARAPNASGISRREAIRAEGRPSRLARRHCAGWSHSCGLGASPAPVSLDTASREGSRRGWSSPATSSRVESHGAFG